MTQMMTRNDIKSHIIAKTFFKSSNKVEIRAIQPDVKAHISRDSYLQDMMLFLCVQNSN